MDLPVATYASKSRTKKKTQKRSFWKRMLWCIAFLIAFIVAVPLILVPVYAVTPAVSTLMLKDLVTLKGYKRTWVSYDKISKNAVYSIMMSEDARHCAHSGVDWVEMQKAWNSLQEGGKGRGASTITMQTVKNLFLWNSRSFVRKGLELPIALYANLIWSKRRTMEIYLNIAEWDNGVYGIEAAAQHYFNIPAAKLNRTQSALLAVTLPNPVKRNPARPTRGLKRLANTIVARARAAGPYVECLRLRTP